MHLDTRVAQVQDQLAAAAALGDERTREIATGLALAAAPAVRLAIIDSVAAAADEITAALLDHPGAPAISLRADGAEIRLSVQASACEPDGELRRDDADTSARISLRLSGALKSEIDAAADADGISVNTWLVRAASAALGADGGRGLAGDARRGKHDHHRITGWING